MIEEATGEVSEKKYPCPTCGAQLRHDADKGVLACDYCGHSQEIPADEAPETPQEYDLETALREGKFEKGWGTELRSISCRSCGAHIDIPPTTEATSCPFCGSPQVVQEQPPEDVFRPETLVPFRIDRKRALEAFRTWVSGGWFRPSALKANWNMGKIAGMYLPFWTFDADTLSLWEAMAGHHYYENVKGPTGKLTRVQKTRWEPANGTHDEFFDDELVFASKGLSRSMVESIEPFDLKQLVPYQPEYLAGWGAERYTVSLKDGWEIGKRKIGGKIELACARAVPGDTHRDLRVRTRWRGMRFKHILLPIWVANYEYGGKVYRFLVNGESGRVHGEAPIDKLKVALAIAAVLAVAAIILWLSR